MPWAVSDGTRRWWYAGLLSAGECRRLPAGRFRRPAAAIWMLP